MQQDLLSQPVDMSNFAPLILTPKEEEAREAFFDAMEKIQPFSFKPELSPGSSFEESESKDLTKTTPQTIHEKIAANPVAFAVGVLNYAVTHPDRFTEYKTDKYRAWAAWAFAILNDKPVHFGDCTGVESSCVLCMLEEFYKDGEEILEDFRELCVEDVSLMLGTITLDEEYWREFEKWVKGERETTPESLEFLDLLVSFWKHPEKDVVMERMKAYIEYIKNPYPIEGIPWW